MNAPFARRVAAAAALLLAAVVAVPAARAGEDNEMKAGVFTPPRAAPDFTLSGSNGAELKLSNHRGKVVLLAFGFTSCTAVCPVTMATLARAHKQLGDQGADVDVVYVTVDPERDDAKRMHDYLAAFDPTFVGGTGTAEQLAAVRQTYGIFANRQETDTGYAYSHSSYTYLIDRDGNLRALMPYGQPPEDYVHDVKILLGSGTSAETRP